MNINIPMGIIININGLLLKALMYSKFNKCIEALVKPQPGHSNKKVLKIHGIVISITSYFFKTILNEKYKIAIK